MIRSLLRSRFFWLVVVYFLFILAWWIKIYSGGQKEGLENSVFNVVYGFIALAGSLNGIYIAYKKWGGHRSVIGLGIIFLSLGLFGEWFGNATWGYFNIVSKIEIPYPGIADIGFFSIIPLYAIGVYQFAKAAGAKFSLQTLSGQLQSILIPLVMVAVSWAFFLKNIPFDLKDPLKLFLDYGYPGGESITVAVTILTYSLSRKFLGGKMRSRILFVIIALVAQFITDYSFTYTAGNGTYYNGSFVDLMYAISLSLMAICLLSFKDIEEN